jgi:antitoxin component YwqK of YwqJK toxin-antitoxin module
MKVITTLVICLCSIICFSQQKVATRYYEGTKDIEIEYQYVIGDKAKVGNITYRDSNTKLLTGVDLNTYTVEQRIRHGYWKEFYRDGTPRATYNYSNGVRDGQATLFHENGKINEKFTLKAGVIEGEFIAYYDNGQIAHRCSYSQGVRIGTAITNDGEGHPLYYMTYSAPVTGVVKIQAQNKFPNGKVAQEGIFQSFYSREDYPSYYSDFQMEGIWKFYNENGVKESEANYSRNVLIGKMNTFYESGKVAEEKYYKEIEINGQKMSVIDGPYKSWHETGALARVGTMKTLITKNPNNDELEEKEYEAGDWKIFDKSGKMIQFVSLGRGDSMYVDMNEKLIEEQSNITENLEFNIYKGRSIDKFGKYLRFHYGEMLTEFDNIPETSGKAIFDGLKKQALVVFDEYYGALKLCSDKNCITTNSIKLDKIYKKLEEVRQRQGQSRSETPFVMFDQAIMQYGIKAALGIN